MHATTTKRRRSLARLWKWTRVFMWRITILAKPFNLRESSLTRLPSIRNPSNQITIRSRSPCSVRPLLARLREQAKSQYISPYAFAVVLTALGDKAHAIDELEHNYDDTGFYISLIKVDPLFDDLRGDPRFEALVQKIARGKQ